MHRTRPLVALLVTVALLGSACGDDGEESATTDAGHQTEAEHRAEGSPTRTINVDMVDHAFQPAQLTVRAGETVRFVFHNKGKVVHEAILGDKAQQDAHEKEMQEHGMDMEHGKSSASPVQPGKTGEVTHTFKAGEKQLFGCHLPGHYKAGMQATITVT